MDLGCGASAWTSAEAPPERGNLCVLSVGDRMAGSDDRHCGTSAPSPGKPGDCDVTGPGWRGGPRHGPLYFQDILGGAEGI